jgi:hypothetical protein
MGGINGLVIFSRYGLECALFVGDPFNDSSREGEGEWLSAQLVPSRPY